MSNIAWDVNRLLDDARKLPPSAQLELIEALVHQLKDASIAVSEPLLDIRSLRGLGKEHWRGVDPQGYIDEERSAWE